MNLAWIKYLPLIYAVVRESVEAVEVLSGPGNGDEKKNAVLDIVRVLATGAFAEKADTILKWAGVMIDVLVAIYNATGKFRKEAPAVG